MAFIEAMLDTGTVPLAIMNDWMVKKVSPTGTALEFDMVKICGVDPVSELLLHWMVPGLVWFLIASGPEILSGVWPSTESDAGPHGGAQETKLIEVPNQQVREHILKYESV